jgi:hypothetical protein
MYQSIDASTASFYVPQKALTPAGSATVTTLGDERCT